jgi:hypothetical protein
VLVKRESEITDVNDNFLMLIGDRELVPLSRQSIINQYKKFSQETVNKMCESPEKKSSAEQIKTPHHQSSKIGLKSNTKVFNSIYHPTSIKKMYQLMCAQNLDEKLYRGV